MSPKKLAESGLTLESQMPERPQAGLDDNIETPRVTGKRKAIAHIPLIRIYPDRYQSRAQLPDEIEERFYSGEIDCFTAMQEWIDLASRNLIYREYLNDITNLKDNIEEKGQIHPVSGIWKETPDGKYYFLIESGEMRFWSTVLAAIQRGNIGDHVTLACIELQNFDIERQVSENEKSKAVTAVARAKEIAGLILAKRGIYPDPAVDKGKFAYHRKATRLRVPEKEWERIGALVNLRSRRGPARYVQILELDDELLKAADAFKLSFRALYHVVTEVPREHQATAIQAEINTILRERKELSEFEELNLGEWTRNNEFKKELAKPAPKEKKTVRYVPYHAKASRRVKNVFISKEFDKDDQLIPKMATELINDLSDIDEMKKVASLITSLGEQMWLRIDSLEKDF